MSVNFAQQEKRKLHHYFIPQAANGHRPHLIRHRALHFYSALIVGIKVFVLMTLFLTYPSLAEFSTITSNHIVELTNKARQEQGLPVLMRNDTLDHSAMLKARDMIKYNYFAHNRPEDGTKPWEWFKQAGYEYTYAGENLAMNFTDADAAVNAWLASPTHRANILNNNYQEIGVAVLVGKIDGRKTTIVVQHFGKSYLSPKATIFSNNYNKATAPKVAGTTQVASGEAIEVELKNTDEPWPIILAHYAQRFLWVILIFVLINLLLTIFVRIKIQHKPIIAHSVIVIIIGLLSVLLHPHFIEAISSSTLKIL